MLNTVFLYRCQLPKLTEMTEMTEMTEIRPIDGSDAGFPYAANSFSRKS